MDTNVVEIDRYIAAPPETVYALVSDVTRMGDWSPETCECRWVGAATGPVVGARFKARNWRGWLRWANTPTVIAADPPREFAFDRRVAGTSVVWRYTMTPEGDGTRLAEFYKLARPIPKVAERLAGLVFGMKDRPAEMLAGMRTTVERIAVAAEAASPA